MSSHVLEDSKLRWIFGWHQHYRSFFITKYDKAIEDENPVLRLGIRPREIPNADGLFTLALMAGLDIPWEYRVQLFRDQDHEESEYFVLHETGKFATGFRTDILAHAELLKDALMKAMPDNELEIRKVKQFTQ